MGKYDYRYASDCIHLHACRRICKAHKIHCRGCNKDVCKAYVNENYGSYIDISDAVSYAISGASSIRGGWDAGDVYAPQDLCGLTLKDIIDEAKLAD